MQIQNVESFLKCCVRRPDQIVRIFLVFNTFGLLAVESHCRASYKIRIKAGSAISYESNFVYKSCQRKYCSGHFRQGMLPSI